MAATIARNFKKNRHTAGFLRTFHTAGDTAPTEAPIAEYETPEHHGGGDGMVEINRGRVAVDDSPMAREARCLECNGFHRGGASCAPRDMRSEGQVRYMNNLIDWITEKNATAGHAARVWTDNVTAAGKWSYDKADKFSISAWIDRLKAKNAELNVAVKAAPIVDTALTGVLPVKLDKNGKAMALRYAVDIEGTTRFYKIKPARKSGLYYIDVQASDEFHQVRNPTTKAQIIKAIVDQGPDACIGRYGQLIGSCGRCGITLTDETSRARGIGPDCWEKMNG